MNNESLGNLTARRLEKSFQVLSDELDSKPQKILRSKIIAIAVVCAEGKVCGYQDYMWDAVEQIIDASDDAMMEFEKTVLPDLFRD